VSWKKIPCFGRARQQVTQRTGKQANNVAGIYSQPETKEPGNAGLSQERLI
jgi:hypothetical protein